MSNLRQTIVAICILITIQSFGQTLSEGSWVVKRFEAKSIQGNAGAEDPLRRLSIYLPPGYDKSETRYPVIYFLHGYEVNDSLMGEWLGLKSLLDKAINSRKIPPVIFVLPNSHTRYLGSFYTDSPLTGKWATYIAKDVVEFIDTNFRTVAHPAARGLCGHSMGGTGAIKIAMNFPDVFSAVYCLSPGALHFAKEFNLKNKGFKKLSTIKDEKEIFVASTGPFSPTDPTFWAPLLASLGRTFSPDESVKPYQAKLPVLYNGDVMTLDASVLKTWEANFPVNMLEDHIDDLKKMKAIMIDWGRNDEYPHIPVTCLELSRRMETLGIPHQAEEYIGTHISKLDERITHNLLPFFAEHLEFPESTQVKMTGKSKKK
jgi:pimeloyl-ACP methyl ester carboxylesterase